MNVYLLTYTPEPEKTIYRCARVCYSENLKIEEDINDVEMKRLLKSLYKSGHHSVFENVVFTFYIDGISRVTSHQLVRHRHASYCQRSQRYVKEEQNDSHFIEPDSIKSNKEAHELFISSVNNTQDTYEKLFSLGIPKEDARYVLPNSCETSMTCTMNLRELIHFFSLRTCMRAQWEIREVAMRMMSLVSGLVPTIADVGFGPSCKTQNKCNEHIPCKKLN
jgi:thymidylate synthase (FAD)